MTFVITGFFVVLVFVITGTYCIINIIAAYGYRSAIISAKIGSCNNGGSLGW